jgi:HEPN domain-containing protein
MTSSTMEEAHAWFRQADADLALADKVRVERPDVACYLAQQGAEKALKAAWICHNKRPRPTHDLVKLVSAAPKRVKTSWKVEMYPDIALLARYEAIARYPSVRGKTYAAPADHFTADHAKAAIQIAKRIVGPCRRFLGN